MRSSWLGPAACAALAVVVGVHAHTAAAAPPAGAALRAEARGEPGLEAEGQDPGEAEDQGEDADTIRLLWLGDCATCHGEDALGTARGPSLADAGAGGVHFMVSTGRMPLTDPDAEVSRDPPAYPPDTVLALARYVGELVDGGVPVPVVPAGGDVPAGGELFREYCAACHAWGGTGGGMLERDAPILEPATPVQTWEAVRFGPGTMPAFGTSALTEDELLDVIAYVEYLDDPIDAGGHPLWHTGPLAEGAVAWIAGIGILLLAVRRIGTRP